MSEHRPRVSVVVPILNEAAHIRDTISAMQRQTVSEDIEFLLVDGGSDDGTRDVLREVERDDPRFRMLDNPQKRTPNALNVGLRAARGEFLVRMDAHAFYEPDYIERGLERLERGDVTWVSGPALPRGTSDGSRRVALALTSRLGFGGAAFRQDLAGELEVDTAFAGVMRREFLDGLGGWDEGWPINQDSELAGRVRKAGGRILCMRSMAAGYVPRSDLRSLGRQYYRYGQYRAKTSGRHPETMRPSHLVPPALVLTLAAAALPTPLRAPARAGVGVYALALAAEAARLSRTAGASDAARLPAIFATMHTAWGAGLFVGSAKFGPPLEGIRTAAAKGLASLRNRPG